MNCILYLGEKWCIYNKVTSIWILFSFFWVSCPSLVTNNHNFVLIVIYDKHNEKTKIYYIGYELLFYEQWQHHHLYPLPINLIVSLLMFIFIVIFLDFYKLYYQYKSLWRTEFNHIAIVLTSPAPPQC